MDRIELEKPDETKKNITWIGQELSDLQEMKSTVNFNTRWTKRLVYVITFFGTLAFLTFYWLVYYVIKNSVLNNIVKSCIGG